MSDRHGYQEYLHAMERTIDRLVDAAEEIGAQLSRMNDAAPAPASSPAHAPGRGATGRYRSKPNLVEAVQWDGSEETYTLMDAAQMPVTVSRALHDGHLILELEVGLNAAHGYHVMPIDHWVVRAMGELEDHWVVSDDYFREKYEREVHPDDMEKADR